MERRPTIGILKQILAAAVFFGLAGTLYWFVNHGDEPTTSPAPPGQSEWSAALQSLTAEGFERPSPDWTLSLPADHAVHPLAQTESWQLSVHLRTAQSTPLGLQFSLMRLGIESPKAPPPDSIWEIRELYRGHVTLLAADAETGVGEEKLARALPEITGYDTRDGSLRMDNWVMRFGDDATAPDMELFATVSHDIEMTLSMRPEKDVLAFAPEGSEAPFVGYAFPRLVVEGSIRHPGGEERVTGTAWLDHAWGDLPIPGAGPVSWDRVQLHLDDGTDLSILRARRTDGRGAATINGLAISAEGAISTFDETDVRMTSTRLWRHPQTGTEYPVAWQIEGPGIDVTLEAVQDAQTHDFTVPFWAGLIAVKGQWNARDVSGLGSMQLTGYANE